MEKKEIEKKINEFTIVYKDLENKIELSSKKDKVKELENITNSDGFWDDIERTKDIIQELKNLNEIIKDFDFVYDKINTIKELLSLELSDQELNEYENELNIIDTELNNLKLDTLLNGEYDSSDAYIEIHSGAGGTESNDW